MERFVNKEDDCMKCLLYLRTRINKMSKKNRNIIKVIANLDFIIAGIALAILVFTTFGGVIMRYFIGKPFAWGEEVQLWCFVWITFFGAGAAFRTGSHVAIEIIVERMPKTMAKYVEFAGYLIVMAVFCFFIYQSGNIVSQMAAMGRSTNILHIPYTVIYSAVPVGCALMMFNYTIVAVKKLREAPEVKGEE